MKFSTKSTYGLRAMANLAENWGNGSISLANIAKEEGISLGYLEKIFAILKRGGFIKSEKGTSGGYSLSRNPKDISIFEVIEALEGGLNAFYCLDDEGKVYCSSHCHCGVTSVMTRVQDAVNSALKDMNVSQLAR